MLFFTFPDSSSFFDDEEAGSPTTDADDFTGDIGLGTSSRFALSEVKKDPPLPLPLPSV